MDHELCRSGANVAAFDGADLLAEKPGDGANDDWEHEFPVPHADLASLMTDRMVGRGSDRMEVESPQTGKGGGRV